MTEKPSQHDQLGPLMDEFLEQFRQGERPSITEYVRRCPEAEDEIRDLFPALVMMEQAGAGEDDTLGSTGKITADGKTIRQLGDYRILREIGRGGMGVVYEAEQESLGRHVALKVLPYYALMDPRHLKRFHFEARAAAGLHHTNIVPVFGVGEHEGIHFYAMQFIQGLGLDEVLEELRKMRAARGGLALDGEGTNESQKADAASVLLSDEFACAGATRQTSPPREQGSAESPPSLARRAGVDTNQESGQLPGIPSREDAGSASESSASVMLPGQTGFSSSSPSDQHYFRSVARVGVQVAEALAHAHGQGVLHRDVNPSNLLLDTHGTVWVTDFGLAKTDGEDLTHTGDLVGTLRYMAPERFRGWSDPRSDLYGLGLTLHEMLTFKPAFDETDRARLVQQVTQEEPIRPRKVDHHIPRDLETIVLKARAKEPYSRYQTAEELAEDLRRFLAGKPIVARRTSLGARTLLWCRRNPVVASLTALVATLLVVIAIGSTVAALRLNQRHKDAIDNLSRATTAEANEREARELATRRLYDAYLAQAQAGRWSGRPGRRFEGLAVLKRAAELVPTLGLGEDAMLELRNEAIACMTLVDLRLDRQWTERSGRASHHRW